VKPGCPNDLGVWMKDQIKASTSSWVLPAMLVFVGAWLLGVVLNRTFKPSHPPQGSQP